MRALTQSGKPQQHLHRQGGFSLIELLIVVAIIVIIAAIAIPNPLHAKIAANEAVAAEVVLTITTATVTYSSTYGNGYPATLANLGGPAGGVSTCDLSVLMDNIIAAIPSQKSGYTFAYSAIGAPVTAVPGCTLPGSNAYLITATPKSEFVTGIRSFCSDEPGTLHYDTTGATAGIQNACENLARPAVVTANRSWTDSQLIAWLWHPASLPSSAVPFKTSLSPRSSRLTRLFMSSPPAINSHLWWPLPLRYRPIWHANGPARRISLCFIAMRQCVSRVN